jgi:hypothetical protein
MNSIAFPTDRAGERDSADAESATLSMAWRRCAMMSSPVTEHLVLRSSLSASELELLLALNDSASGVRTGAVVMLWFQAASTPVSPTTFVDIPRLSCLAEVSLRTF